MNKKKCFVIMPFSKTTEKHDEEYWNGFYDILYNVMTDNGYDCRKSEIGPYDIFSKIVEQIEAADIVIAVLTDYNANVWYELGIRHTLKSGTVMLIQADQNVPFDIRSFGIVKYKDSYGLKDYLKKEINRYLDKIDDNTCDSPVKCSLKGNVNMRNEDVNNKLEKKIQDLENLLWKILDKDKKEDNFKNNSNVKRLLWVDDYPSNNRIIMDLFENKNVKFDIAITTQQGIERYKSQDYDVIITDMGRQNRGDAGLDLIKQLKKMNCQVPIIVYASCSAIEKYGKKALNYGAQYACCATIDVISCIHSTLKI